MYLYDKILQPILQKTIGKEHRENNIQFNPYKTILPDLKKKVKMEIEYKTIEWV